MPFLSARKKAAPTLALPFKIPMKISYITWPYTFSG